MDRLEKSQDFHCSKKKLLCFMSACFKYNKLFIQYVLIVLIIDNSHF